MRIVSEKHLKIPSFAVLPRPPSSCRDLDSLTSRVSALQAAVDASMEEVGLLQSSHASLQGKEAQLLADLAAADKRKGGVEEEARVLRDRVSQLEVR